MVAIKTLALVLGATTVLGVPQSPDVAARQSGFCPSSAPILACCNSVLPPLDQLLSGLVGVITGLLGGTCLPITLWFYCGATLACCRNNGLGGLLNLDCGSVPIG